MKKTLLLTMLFSFLYNTSAFAGVKILQASQKEVRKAIHRNTIDASDIIECQGSMISYRDTVIALNEYTLFLDGSMPDSVAERYPYVFNDFHKLATALHDGSAERPMTVYIAPYVYWIDDPDDPAIRKGINGREPFGMTIRCHSLHLRGINADARNTVLAAQRGQAQGAVGNFTMFDFWGDGLFVENLTMGNFCNVDLEYPLLPSLGRKKRMASITQAHIAYCHGDKTVARNVRFISRLNMNPLSGDKRVLFDMCHMECTDDALAKTGVYLRCHFDFWGERPFWRSDMGGAVFLDCDFDIRHHSQRTFFCKAVGPLAVVDSRFHASETNYIGWTNTPTEWLRAYQYNITFNGQPYIIGADKPYNTVCMDRKGVLAAYRLTDNDGNTLYNTFNLLRGEDDWDPMNIREKVEELEKRDGRDYTHLPTCLSITPLTQTIQTGECSAVLRAEVKRHCNYALHNAVVRWRIEPGYEQYAKLSVKEGNECIVTPCVKTDSAQHFSVIAYTEDGLECATELTVLPPWTPAPKVVEKPHIRLHDGVAELCYSLALEGRNDESLITWYKASDSEGKEKYPVAVTRGKTPQSVYSLQEEDEGYYLLATLQPKHLRSLPGEAIIAVTPSKVSKKNVLRRNFRETDFRSFPSANQTRIFPGIWTLDGYKPLDTMEYEWDVTDINHDFWIYGEGINGAKGEGLYQNAKGARMMYTPVAREYGAMTLQLHVDAAKLAGQGFGSPTGQYMDVYIKFDPSTLSGYALRIIRTTKYSNAVDFLLVKYRNGIVENISEPVSTSCYRTNCFITLKAEGGRLTAHAETTTPHRRHDDPNVLPYVDLEAEIEWNTWGGYGIQHTGSAPGESITMLHNMRVEWR